MCHCAQLYTVAMVRVDARKAPPNCASQFDLRDITAQSDRAAALFCVRFGGLDRHTGGTIHLRTCAHVLLLRKSTGQITLMKFAQLGVPKGQTEN